MVFVDTETHVVSSIDQRFALGKDRRLPLIMELPHICISSISTQTRKEMFDISLRAWENVYRPNEFQNVVLQTHTPQNHNYLKRVRKYGLILRSAYRFLAAGTFPQEHKEFVQKLGNLNDNHNSANASILRREVHVKSDSLPHVTQPILASDEEFQRVTHVTIALVREALQAKVLRFEDYHNLRKRTRHLLNLVLLLNMVEGDMSPLTKAYAFGANFITRMGDDTDQGLINGKQPVRIDPSIKQAALRFVDIFVD